MRTMFRKPPGLGLFAIALSCALGLVNCQTETSPFEGCSTYDLALCPTSDGYANPYEGQLELLSWTETLRKASLELTGKLPTDRQVRVTEEQGQLGLEASLWEMMQDERFYTRIMELYNDHFLTDKYLGRENAIDLLDEDVFPNLRWYEQFAGGSDDVALQTNDSIAREALELIAHVIRAERPFTEILTADYTVANGYSAPSFIGYPDFEFRLSDHPERFRKMRVPGIPHAGILTSPMFLNRFPTSDTNVNRHRSRMAYWFFLGFDINALGNRPIDVDDSAGENPTMNNPNCTTCHATMDPVAGLFMNWDERGVYERRGGWHDDMRAPGFGGEELPASEYDHALQWFAAKLAAHPGFATTTVSTVFAGLTGQQPLALPGDDEMPIEPQPDAGMPEPDAGMPEPDAGAPMDDAGMPLGDAGMDPVEPPPAAADPADALMRARMTQQQILGTMRQRFVDNNYNFKVLVREIVLSPYFRAKESAPMTPELETELSTFGTARFLTPEHLTRKIEATTGVNWRRRPGETDYLLNQYRIFYGGIDSDQVTNRITDPNGVMASLAQRMAYEVSCSAVPFDFSKKQSQRLLFPNTDHTQAMDPDSTATREAIVHLHQRLLGESLATNDPEVDADVALLTELLGYGRAGLADGTVPEELANPCRVFQDRNTGEQLPNSRHVRVDPDYTVRAWMGLTTYLLADYRFLYE